MILDKIVERTKERYKDKLDKLDEIKKLSERRAIFNPNFFYEAIGKDGISFICEVKKASPSKGVISEDFPYMEIAKKYPSSIYYNHSYVYRSFGCLNIVQFSFKRS